MTDILETLKAEIDEAVDLSRAHFPADSESALRHRAEGLRHRRYEEGQWPDFAVVAEDERKEAIATARLQQEEAIND